MAFIGGSFVAFVLSASLMSQANGGVELHPDIEALGAVCLFCPLVGLLAALVTSRLTREMPKPPHSWAQVTMP